jgi:hypothetical protein
MTAGDTIPLLYFRQDQCYLISAEFSRLLRRQFFAVAMQIIDRGGTHSTSANLEFPWLVGRFPPARHSGAAKICFIPGQIMLYFTHKMSLLEAFIFKGGRAC